jgi:hypothetical protein
MSPAVQGTATGTRERLLAAAQALIEEGGYSAASVIAIDREASATQPQDGPYVGFMSVRQGVSSAVATATSRSARCV